MLFYFSLILSGEAFRMHARIEINKMMAWTLIGALSEERLRRRPVAITISMYYDLSRPAKTDALCDAIDYSCVQSAVLDAVETASFQLMEALAARIVAVVLTFEGVLETTVTVEKPNALDNCESVAVVLNRKRC